MEHSICLMLVTYLRNERSLCIDASPSNQGLPYKEGSVSNKHRNYIICSLVTVTSFRVIMEQWSLLNVLLVDYSPRWFHPLSTQCFATDMVYYIFIVSKLQCITHAIMIKVKVLLPQTRMILFRRIGLFLLPNNQIF
jgi:hypothetical protein